MTTLQRHLICAGLLFVVSLAAVPLAAQVNIEAQRTGTEQHTWSHVVGLDGGLRAGSVDRREAGLDLHSAYDSHSRHWLVVVDAEIGWQDGARYSNQGLVHMRFGQTLSERLGVETFLQFDHARQRRLLRRALIGGGLRWQWVQDLFVGSGLMVEAEKHDLPRLARHASRTRHTRSTNYLSGRVGVGLGELVFTAYVQPRFIQINDVRTLVDARLSAPLSDRASLSVNVRLRHDTKPVDSVEELDLKLSVGASFTL
jgi:hypothetical protein